MFHLDNNSGISSMPKPAAQQSAAPRWFTEGSGNDSPSWPGQDWFNIIQAELLNVLAEANISPDKAVYTQLAQAIKEIIAANSNVRNALLKGNNLSDVADAGKSLANLGGVPTGRKVNGHALSSDVSVTAQDIFGGQAITLGENKNLNDCQTPGLYFQAANANTSAALNYPENNAGALIVLRSAGITQLYYVYNSSRIWSRSQYSTGSWTPWAREYNTLNKPSAADVGAVSKTGDTMSGDLTLASGKAIRSSDVSLIRYATDSGGYIQVGDNQHVIHIGGASSGEVTIYSGANINLNSNVNTNRYYNVKSEYGAGSYASQYAQLAPYYNEFNNSQTSQYQPLWKQKDLHNGLMWSGGMLVNAGNFAIHFISKDGKTSGTFDFRKDGTFVPASFANFDSRYQSKGNYTPAGEAYTKAQSDSRYVQNMQLGAQVMITTQYAPAGCCVTYVDGGQNSQGIGYKPIQININGAWRTISG